MSELDRIKRELCTFSSRYVVNKNESVALDCFPCLPDDKTRIARTFLNGISYNEALDSLLCVLKNLKVAVTNDVLQRKCNPAPNTSKLAKMFLTALEQNPYMRACCDSNGFPVKYFVYLNPSCQKTGGFRPGNELMSKEIVAVDKNCCQFSIGALSCPETRYISDPVESNDPNVTYLKAVNQLEQFLRVALRAGNKVF